MARDDQLIYGLHAVSARLRHHPQSVLELFVNAGRHDRRLRDALALAQARGVRVVAVETPRLQGLVGHGAQRQSTGL